MRFVIFSSVCTFLTLLLCFSGGRSVQAGWLSNWIMGRPATSVLSEAPPSVTSEFYSPPRDYGGPRVPVVTAPEIWETTRTPADLAAQQRVFNDWMRTESGLKDSIVRNVVAADRAIERARKNSLLNTSNTAGGTSVQIIRPVKPTSPHSPTPPGSPQGTMPFERSSEDTGSIQAILPQGIERRPAPVLSREGGVSDGKHVIQPILPILRPSVAKPKKE